MRATIARALIGIALLLSFVGAQQARADHCNDASGSPRNIIIYSYPAGLYVNGLVCFVAPDVSETAGLDARVIWPGSDQVSVRYAKDLGVGTPQLSGVL